MLGTTMEARDPRATQRRLKRPYKAIIRMRSKVDQLVAKVEDGLAAEPQPTALAIGLDEENARSVAPDRAWPWRRLKIVPFRA
jgi:hypothetical protein